MFLSQLLQYMIYHGITNTKHLLPTTTDHTFFYIQNYQLYLITLFIYLLRLYSTSGEDTWSYSLFKDVILSKGVFREVSWGSELPSEILTCGFAAGTPNCLSLVAKM